MIKLSRKRFYEFHTKELSKYLPLNGNVLHLTSNPSDYMENETNLKTIVLEKNNLDKNYKNLQDLDYKFDLIIITDIFEVSNDIYGFVSNLKNFLNLNGKILLTSINPKWNIILRIFEILGLKKNSYINSYIQPKKISSIFVSLGFENIRNYNKQIFPFRILGIGTILNIFLEIVFSFFNLGIKTYFLYQNIEKHATKLSKTIIVPAKNEEGNLQELVSRIPKFNEYYEIIIACGPSKDNTINKALEIKESKIHENIIVFEQSKNGKANAVWEATDRSSCEVIAILDADISVDPEELVYFFEIIENGYCDFVNGTRLMYPMEDSAMRVINKFGNRSFQLIISKLINVNLSDTLCGTKVFKKESLYSLKKWQESMSIADPFCDFDLIFSNAISGVKISEYPVHYRNRKYGKTNISRFRDGWKLIIYLFNSLLLFKSSYYRSLYKNDQ